MTKRTLWDPTLGEFPVNLAFTNNFAASAAPTVTDDSSKGYSAGSVWIYNTPAPDSVYICSDATVGAAVWNVVSEGGGTPGQVQAPNASTATGTGSNASITGGAGGSTSGAGGKSGTYGGAATAGNSNGGAAELVGGAGQGTGRQGAAVIRGYATLVKRPAKAAVSTSATLTAAQLISGILANQAGGASASYQLPLASDLDTALPEATTGDTFEFTVTNVSTVAAEDATITTNTGWTLYGSMVVASNAAATDISAAVFEARKTGTATWTLTRIT